MENQPNRNQKLPWLLCLSRLNEQSNPPGEGVIPQMAFDPKRIWIPKTMGLPQWAMENCPKSIETPHLKIVPRAKTDVAAITTSQTCPGSLSSGGDQTRRDDCSTPKEWNESDSNSLVMLMAPKEFFVYASTFLCAAGVRLSILFLITLLCWS
jgi:hypothetical protein